MSTLVKLHVGSTAIHLEFSGIFIVFLRECFQAMIHHDNIVVGVVFVFLPSDAFQN
jgi:hypothetical protein